MSTTTQLTKLPSREDIQEARKLATKSEFREMWADGLAAIAAVALLSILAFEFVRMLVQ